MISYHLQRTFLIKTFRNFVKASTSTNSWTKFLAMSEKKLIVKAAENNKAPILEVLETIIPEKLGAESILSALEISSGSGQHVVHFAQKFPKITWQPSDVEGQCIESIKEYIADEKVQNVKDPQFIDVSKPVSEWSVSLPGESQDIIVNINMVHITPWQCAEGLFAAAGKLLKPNGVMVMYGPYAVHGEITPESNVRFDAHLKAQNAAWGLRDVDDLEKEAKKNGMTFDAMFDMPSNNKTLVWLKDD